MNLNFQITHSMNENIFTLKLNRGGVEDTRLEAKDTKQIQGYGHNQGLTFRGQTLSRPRTRMLEAKDTTRMRSPKKNLRL